MYGIWLRNFVTRLHIVDGVERSVTLFCGNKLAVLYSNNNKSSTKSKHINFEFLVVKEKVQIMDPLTKGLPPKMFHEHNARVGVISLSDVHFLLEF
ncbi:hypothetical protein CR513_56522, partial [Mucuna pruriens]